MSATPHTPLWAVVVGDQKITFGPFTSRVEANRFAEFATREIDPAEVRMLCSPVTELLNWRDMTLRGEE